MVHLDQIWLLLNGPPNLSTGLSTVPSIVKSIRYPKIALNGSIENIQLIQNISLHYKLTKERSVGC